VTRALLDATVLIAAADVDDADHDAGLEILRGVDHGEPRPASSRTKRSWRRSTTLKRD
jgi:hypothetical protein